MSRPDHYATLGVAPDASVDDIKRAYRRAARHAHPDRGGNHERMQALNEAKDVLTDPARRARYDAGEDGQASTEEEAARALILQLFAEAVDVNKDDPVEGVREALQTGRTGAAVKATMLRRSINRLESQRNRVRAKTERNVYLNPTSQSPQHAGSFVSGPPRAQPEEPCSHLNSSWPCPPSW